MGARRKVVEALAALAAALAFACAQAQPIEVRDDRGQPVRLAAPARRIVSLLPSLTETVCALGACGRLVATDRYSDWPAEVRTLPKAGGLEDANVERIAALKPDLVLAAASTRALERLQALGLPVAALEPKNHADLRRVLDTVAQLLGQADAAPLWRRIERDTEAAAARVPAGWRGRTVYFEVDAGPYAAEPASFIGQTLQRLGLRNIVPPALGPFPKLNPEFVVRADPDLVIAGRRELEEMGARPGWAAMRALRGRRLCSLERAEADMLVRPGPRLGEAAARIADCLGQVAPP